MSVIEQLTNEWKAKFLKGLRHIEDLPTWAQDKIDLLRRDLSIARDEAKQWRNEAKQWRTQAESLTCKLNNAQYQADRIEITVDRLTPTNGGVITITIPTPDTVLLPGDSISVLRKDIKKSIRQALSMTTEASINHSKHKLQLHPKTIVVVGKPALRKIRFPQDQPKPTEPPNETNEHPSEEHQGQ